MKKLFYLIVLILFFSQTYWISVSQSFINNYKVNKSLPFCLDGEYNDSWQLKIENNCDTAIEIFSPNSVQKIEKNELLLFNLYEIETSINVRKMYIKENNIDIYLV